MPDVPAGPATSPVIQLYHWVRRPIPFMEECAARYGDRFTIRLPIFGEAGDRPPLVFFSDPEAVKEIFTGNDDELRAGEANAPLLPLLGEHSLLMLDGARHLHERRLMMPPFHGERMQAYGETMCEVTDASIEAWPAGRPFPIHPHMQRITLDVILRTVFGLEEGAQMVRLRDLLTELLAFSTNPLALLPWFRVELGGFTPWGRLMRASRAVDEMLFAEIRRRREVGTTGRTDILSMLIEARDEDDRPMSDVELRDEMFTLLVAGHETTATSLCWVFHRILRRPDVLEKLRAELARVVGTGPVRPEHVPALEYLDATIKETLRLNPIIPIVPDPERFDPDRFVGQRVSPYAFFPFGGGIRRCLGMAFALYEMRVVTAEVLQRVVLRAAPGYQVRVVRRGITFAPSDGLPVLAEKRAA
ncbi:MAG: cytochrome P450 [Deltaproteobacteria bacterium]|nr:MAG: cytochrome P450 [Deltaproteobacteria bacterium]